MHLEESSRSMTAFITPFGVYEWKVLPMGVKVGPQVFQRLVAWVVRNWMTDVGTKRFPGPHEPGRPGANNTQSPPTTPVGRACSACMCACTGRRPGAIASHRGIFEARVPQVGVHVELRVGDVCQPDLIELGLRSKETTTTLMTIGVYTSTSAPTTRRRARGRGKVAFVEALRRRVPGKSSCVWGSHSAHCQCSRPPPARPLFVTGGHNIQKKKLFWNFPLLSCWG